MSTKKSNTQTRKAKSTRSIINDNWKKDTFSMSALVRYAKGNGVDDVQKFIDEVNGKFGTSLTIGNVNTKNIVKHATERELFKNAGTREAYVKGDKKEKFSFWLVILTIGRLAKASKA